MNTPVVQRDLLIVNERLSVPRSEFRLGFARSSGPGGQNVNKVNSKVTLHWNVSANTTLPDDVRQRFLTRYASRLTTEGELVVVSQRFRDQGRNIDDCYEKLRELVLSVAVPPKTRRATRPTRGSKERRLEGKRRQQTTKRLRRGPVE